MRHYLDKFLEDFSTAIVAADSEKPQKYSPKGKVYQHGIGPHTENETVAFVLWEFPENSGRLMASKNLIKTFGKSSYKLKQSGYFPFKKGVISGDNWWADCSIRRLVSYPRNKRMKCDLCINSPDGKLFIEVKMMRLFGDNGKFNDNITTHILSPYPEHRSALTDIRKLKESGFEGEKAIVIFGYDYQDYPMVEMMDYFEKMAIEDLETPRISYKFEGLVHPVHQRGEVYGWMIKE